MLLGALLCAATLAVPPLDAEVKIEDSDVSDRGAGSVKLRIAMLTLTSPTIGALAAGGISVEIADLPSSLAHPSVSFASDRRRSRLPQKNGGGTAPDTPDRPRKEFHLTICALLRDPAAKEAVFKINFRDMTGKIIASETVRWDLSAARKASTSPSHEWFRTHLSQLEDLGTPDGDDPILAIWSESAKPLYGDYHTSLFGGRGGSRNQTRRQTADLGAMSVLGGRTAITETLQTQLIAAGGGEKDGTGRTLERVPAASVAGVAVKAHPCAQMAADLKLPPAAPSLADYAPADRLFAHIREPRQLAAIWDGSDDAVSGCAAKRHSSRTKTGSSIR
jgi:hypothetical protein